MVKLPVVIRDIWVLPYSHPSPHQEAIEESLKIVRKMLNSSIASCLDCFSFLSLFFGGGVITEAFNISYS